MADPLFGQVGVDPAGGHGQPADPTGVGREQLTQRGRPPGRAGVATACPRACPRPGMAPGSVPLTTSSLPTRPGRRGPLVSRVRKLETPDDPREAAHDDGDPMQLGMIGLGRMGANLVRRLHAAGHECVAYDHNPDAVNAIAAADGRDRGHIARGSRRQARRAARGLGDGAGRRRRRRRSTSSRRCWSRATPSSTAATATTATTSSAPASSKANGIDYVDCGTSGGVFGLERGFCLMIGGPRTARRAPRPDLPRARARASTPRRARPAAPATRARRGGLSALRTVRCRPLREDGAQRHRVRR